MQKQENSPLRTAVHSLYDLQKLRIQTGNRLFQQFRHQLGIESSDSEDEMSKEAKAVVQILRLEYKRITDGVVKTKLSRMKDTGSSIITNLSQLYLVQGYERLLESEECHVNIIKSELKNYPIYDAWLKDISGVGPLMAGVMLSEFDINKSKHPSGFIKYAGIDTNVWFEIKSRFSETAPDRVYKRHPDGFTTRGPAYMDYGDTFELHKDGILIGLYGFPEEGTEGFKEGRCRKQSHLVPKTYVNKDGEITETKGITFNPFLKTKLVGVLGGCFIKAGGEYKSVYDSYKAHISTLERHADKTKKHIHNMAVRYMIRTFLIHFWTEWRKLEGLPVSLPYEAAKLGKVVSLPSPQKSNDNPKTEPKAKYQFIQQ